MRFKVSFSGSSSWLVGFMLLAGIFAASAASSGTAVAAPAHKAALIEPITAPNYRAIIDRYGPAVVGVTVEDGRRGPETSNPAAANNGSATSDIPGNSPQDSRRPVLGLGSGFVIDAKGLVLTNAHVVNGASSVTVTLNDRREFKAKVLGLDPDTDIAVLKIDVTGLPTVTLGDSDALKVGDYVLAIGTPFGFDATATSGIVSALHRLLPNNPLVPFIQTDAAVNPGNSGGPLFNASGEVVGINAQIYSQTGGYEGLSFAIPIDLAEHVADQIITSGKVRHAELGIDVQQLTQPLADSFGLARPDGALISRVKPHGAAWRAGLLAGDVILQCNSANIRQAADVSALIGVARPQDSMKFVVWRNGDKREITAVLGPVLMTSGDEDATAVTTEYLLGLTVKVLSMDERKSANVSRGLLVVNSSGPSERAGIVPGDLVLAINGKPIDDAEQLRSLVGIGESTVALLIQRGDARTYIPIVFEK